MNLAISNIAWEQHEDPAILDLLRANNVTGVEVAPTKIWQEWRGASHKEATKYKDMMNSEGFEIPALQAILFAKPELQLFNRDSHYKFFQHLKLVSELADGFGSKVIVFGAPKNRKRGQCSNTQASKIAIEFFHKASQICGENNCSLALEHNPVEYGCDFITNVRDAKELVEMVNHKNFKLHIDSAGVHMCGGNISDIVKDSGEFVHYHISEPMLEPIVDGIVNHKDAIDTLKDIGYQGWVSIEMKQPTSIELLEKSLQKVNAIVF